MSVSSNVLVDFVAGPCFQISSNTYGNNFIRMEVLDDSDSDGDFVSLLDMIGPDHVMDLCSLKKGFINGLNSMICTLDLTRFGPLDLVRRGDKKKKQKKKKSVEPARAAAAAAVAARTVSLGSLQCPFNWKSLPGPAEEFRLQDQFMQMAEPAWDNVSCRVSAAYSMIMEGDLAKARSYLVQLYMVLLDMPHVCAYSDDSLRRYRPALKHVVDAMWAWYFTISFCGFKGLEPSSYVLHPDIQRLVNEITPFSSFSEKQKAAIYVLQTGTWSPQELSCGALMQRALAISPEESTWHCMLGWKYQQARMTGKGTANLQLEIKAFEDSVKLERNSDNLRMLAYAYIGLKSREGYRKAKNLISELLSKWPERVTVLNSVSVMLMEPGTPLTDLRGGLKCLKKATSLVGETLFLNFQIGSAYYLMNRYDEAQEYLERCRSIMPDADEMLKIIVGKKNKGKKKQRQRQEKQSKNFS